MRYLSVCSGIEAATVAWHPLGWEAVAYSEIEKFPSQVLAHHYPNVPNVGDMTKFKEWTNVSNVNVLVGGTPCQSFSVAGLRKGLDDPRGNLMLTYLAIAAKFRPKWLVWENVPGVLSSNGGLDFASLLRGMGECGYGFAYRILDAQYFGVAQRRRRVFVVGCLGDWRAAAAVLFERHSLSGYPAPSREKRKSVTPGTGPSSPDGGETIGTLMARDYKGFGNQDMKDGRGLVLDPILIGGQDCKHFSSEISGTLVTREGSVSDTSHMLMQPIPIDSMNHIGRGDKHSMGDFVPGAPCYTLTKGHSHAVAQPIPFRDTADCLTAAYGTKWNGNASADNGSLFVAQPIPFDTTQITSKANYSKPQAGDPCHPLAAGAHPPAICLMDQGGSVMTIENDITGTLRRETHGHEPVVMAFPWQSALDPIGKPTDLCGTLIKNQTPAVMYPTEVAPTLTAANNPSRSPQSSEVTQQVYSVYQASMAVRRLTPVECERLQGFSDNYTNIKDKCPDGPRYKALGNSMAVPVMAWIGKRIQDVESIKK